MKPEISHRCSNCGAAIRSRAQFCAQCGKPLKPGKTDAAKRAKKSETANPAPAERELKTTPLTPPQISMDPVGDVTSNVPPQHIQDAEKVKYAAKAIVVEEKQAKIHRVKDAARDMVQENVRPRVEKLRKASNVVLEEAAIDPSLRFVLIAVFIFIVFVTVLLLSFIK